MEMMIVTTYNFLISCFLFLEDIIFQNGRHGCNGEHMITMGSSCGQLIKKAGSLTANSLNQSLSSANTKMLTHKISYANI